MKHTWFTKVGAYGILTIIISGCFVYLPPLFQGAAFVIGASNKIAKAEEMLQDHEKKITDQNSAIREFRAVWCIDRMSGRVVQRSVVEACTKWIKEP